MSEGRPGSAHTSSSEQTHQSQAASGAGGGAYQSAHVNHAGYARQGHSTIDGDRYKLMFTGPDGQRNHTVRRCDGEFTGTGERSFERTGNLNYMFRMPKEFPFPKGKHGRLGEIGGEIELWKVKKGL